MISIGCYCESIEPKTVVPILLDLLTEVNPLKANDIYQNSDYEPLFLWLRLESKQENPDCLEDFFSEVSQELNEHVPPYCFFGVKQQKIGCWIRWKELFADIKRQIVYYGKLGEPWPADIKAYQYALERNRVRMVLYDVNGDEQWETEIS